MRDRTMWRGTVLTALTGLMLTGNPACSGDNGTLGDDTPTEHTFAVRIENVAPWRVLKSGTQATKTNGATGPLAPGESFEVTFTAGKGHAISFASMLGESNDWFFAPDSAGIALYDARGNATSGAVTQYIKLWDAGTELDQEPAVGAATAPRQPTPNFGAADPQPGVKELRSPVALDTSTSFTVPAVNRMIAVTLTPGPEQMFTLTIKNVSTASTLVTSQGPKPVHLSPIAWTVHALPAPLFASGTPASEGIERVAEDGMPDALGAMLADQSGFHTPLSPGVFVVHRDATPLFALGAPASAGLERIAEDGNPMVAAPTATGVFDTPIGATAARPAMPGEAFAFQVTASPGDRLSFATMFGMSNDWFFAPDGIALFADGTPRTGDVTGDVALHDAGTEVDEEIAIGPDTAPQQPAPNTGAADAQVGVRVVTPDRYAVPVTSHLRVTLDE
jgi:hypothetical protein